MQWKSLIGQEKNCWSVRQEWRMSKTLKIPQVFTGLSLEQTVLWNPRSWLNPLMLLFFPDWGSVVLVSPFASLFSSPLSLSTDKSAGWDRVLACRGESHLQQGNWAVCFSTVNLWSSKPRGFQRSKHFLSIKCLLYCSVSGSHIGCSYLKKPSKQKTPVAKTFTMTAWRQRLL